MKILVSGSRDIEEGPAMRWLETLNLTESDIIIHGGCVGVDSHAQKYAEIFSIPTIVVLPDWEKYGKKAGPLRNIMMVEEADCVHVLWNGKSRGTKSTIDAAIKQKKDLTVKIYQEQRGRIPKLPKEPESDDVPF